MGVQRGTLKLETVSRSDCTLLLAADLGLGLLPEGLQFADAASLKVAAQGGLDPGEAIEEAVVGAGQAGLRVNAASAGHVHEGEENIPEFLLGVGLVP